jgi:acetyltransferase-like isoleucine patch superfamily enzyme
MDSSVFPRGVFRIRAWLGGLAASIRTWWWRMLGMRVGAGTRLPKIYVTWPHQVSLGRHCAIEQLNFFKYDGIWTPGPKLVIGDHVFLGAGCEFNFRRGITIGSHCLIASGCRFVDHDHQSARRDIPMAMQSGGPEAPITLENDVWLGANVVVLKGVTIGRGAIVASGAVVTHSIPAHEIWGGVPARKMGERPL